MHIRADHGGSGHVIDAGPLAEGWRFQRDTPAYGVRLNAQELHAALAAARRYRDMP